MKKIILVTAFWLVYITQYSQMNTLKETIFFNIGKTNLTQAHKNKLDSVIIVINASETYKVDLKGYTCNIGSLSINNVVSKLRALNVYNYLVDKGVERKHIKYEGKAMYNPLGDNKTADGRAKNRRTEIEVLFKLMDLENIQQNNNSLNNNASNNKQNSNTTINKPAAKTIEIGPEMVTGQFTNENNKLIKSSNGIQIEIPEYSFSSPSKEPFEFDMKDYTQNYDIIKKNIATKSGKQNLMLMGAYSLNFTQGNEEITLNTNSPVKVYIPGAFDPEVKLYTNHRNWTLDTINALSYDDAKKSYVITTKYLGQMFGLLKPMPETSKNVLFKISNIGKGEAKPYAIFDNCMIVSGNYVKGKLYSFPIPSDKSSFKIRAAYSDFSSKTPTHYYLNEDIKQLEPKQISNKKINEKEFMRICTPSKFQFKQTQIDRSSLCETPQN